MLLKKAMLQQSYKLIVTHPSESISYYFSTIQILLLSISKDLEVEFERDLSFFEIQYQYLSFD